jgi:hypothetical protein
MEAKKMQHAISAQKLPDKFDLAFFSIKPSQASTTLNKESLFALGITDSLPPVTG